MHSGNKSPHMCIECQLRSKQPFVSIFSGFMAGGDKSWTGSGSNYVCLSDQPTWAHYDENIESLGKLTGSEYRFYGHRSNGASDFLGQYMYHSNAPCAVCLIQRRTSVMFPGRANCLEGWTKEYGGYLISGSAKEERTSEYVCLDNRPEKIVNGDNESNDHRLFFVEAVCSGSLACPPYIAGREIACVVCSL